VHHYVDLRSVHGFRCYDNIAPNAECQQVLVLALYVVSIVNATCHEVCVVQALYNGVDVPLPPANYTGPSVDSKHRNFSLIAIAFLCPLTAVLVSKQ